MADSVSFEIRAFTAKAGLRGFPGQREAGRYDRPQSWQGQSLLVHPRRRGRPGSQPVVKEAWIPEEVAV